MVKIKRSIDYRFKQLDDAVQSLGNSLNSFETTKRQHHLLDIMARLRALVAIGGKNMTPLLFSLADEISFPLSFYGSDITIGMTKVVTGVVIGKSWSPLPREGYSIIEFRDWLKQPVYHFDTTEDIKTRNQVLKDISNSLGGSHYETQTPHAVDGLERITLEYIKNKEAGTKEVILKESGVDIFLRDVAYLVLWLSQLTIVEYRIQETQKLSVLTKDSKAKQIKQWNDHKTRLNRDFNELKIGAPAVHMQLGRGEKL